MGQLRFLTDELSRRGVWRAAAAYLVTSWLILEVGHLLTIILELPHWSMKLVFAMLVIGFPLALGLTWYFRLVDGGLLPEIELPETEPAAAHEHELHLENEEAAEHAGHAGPAHAGPANAEPAHAGHGHGGHGGHGGTDPLPIILGVMAVAAVGLLAVTRLSGTSTAEHATPAPPPRAEAQHRAAPPASIAVLPFANLSGDPAQDYFSDGLSEELRSTLASFSALNVAARTSSTALRGSDARTTGTRLGVAYVLEGSVRRSGDQLRIGTALIEVATGFERWSQTFDRKLTDAFAVQADIAAEVGNALKVRLLAPPTAHGRGGTTDPAALDAYLRGRQAYDLVGDRATYERALADFDTAIADDPAYAAAYAGRARTLIALANQFARGPEMRAHYDAALVAARRAVALAPALPDAQSALGFALYNRLDFAGAGAAYDKAKALSSGDADQLIRYGLFKARMGDFAAAHAALDRAAALDPLNPRVPRAQGSAFQAERRYRDAIAALTRALALNPVMNGAHGAMGDAWLMLGDAAAARAEYQREPQALTRLPGLAIVLQRSGDASGARAALAELNANSGDNSLYQQGQVQAQWGATDAALTALEAARRAGDTGLVLLRNDPLLDPVRDTPRFKALVAALRFPPVSTVR